MEGRGLDGVPDRDCPDLAGEGEAEPDRKMVGELLPGFGVDDSHFFQEDVGWERCVHGVVYCGFSLGLTSSIPCVISRFALEVVEVGAGQLVDCHPGL